MTCTPCERGSDILYMWSTRALTTVAVAVLVAGCSGSNAGTQASGNAAGNVPAAHPAFRQASNAEKSQLHPSTSTGTLHVQDRGHHGSVVLVSWLNFQAGSNVFQLSEATSGKGVACDANLFDAPWFIAEGDSTLYQGKAIELNDCDPANANLTQPSTNDYIVMADIGRHDIDLVKIAGPATETNGVLQFTPIVNPVSFEDDHVYAFFLVQYQTGGDDHGGGDD